MNGIEAQFADGWESSIADVPGSFSIAEVPCFFCLVLAFRPARCTVGGDEVGLLEKDRIGFIVNGSGGEQQIEAFGTLIVEGLVASCV